MRAVLTAAAFAAALFPTTALHADEPVAIRLDRDRLEAGWQARIQGFLDRGVVPLVDLESTLRRQDGERYLDDALTAMDALGVALVAFDGAQAPRSSRAQTGYRWSYYVHEIVNAHPDRFIPATNGGTSRNWTRGKASYIGQLETELRSGAYPIIGEIEFRHYMSNRQCRDGRTDRDVDVPIEGANGQRVFRLAAETGAPLVIHHEPEDGTLAALERMLSAYPKAVVVVAHFGQVRHPERSAGYGPASVRRLLSSHPNLYFDTSTGPPGRRYRCTGALDTVLWQDGFLGAQSDTLKTEWRAILTDFSTRFVAATDYGGGRGPLADHLRERIGNIRLILRDLPIFAKHDIGYRNAWRLITGREWGSGSGRGK